MTASETPTPAAPEVFGRPEIREAIALLRECGVTPDQYAAIELIERWTVDGIDGEFPDREAAFDAAEKLAAETGMAEVWRSYGDDIPGGAESWIIQPQIVDTLRNTWPRATCWVGAGAGRWRAHEGPQWRYVATDGATLATLLVDELHDNDETARAKVWEKLSDSLRRQKEGGSR